MRATGEVSVFCGFVFKQFEPQAPPQKIGTPPRRSLAHLVAHNAIFSKSKQLAAIEFSKAEKSLLFMNAF
jgi:hypothetical protein